MKLRTEQIQSATLGAVRTLEEADGIHFFRFTETQEAVYRCKNPDFYQKSRSSAGIQLCFVTDSDFLKLDLTYSRGSSRPFAITDVICDGRIIGHIGSGDSAEGRYEKDFRFENGEKEIRIVFPWSSATVLNTLELADGSSFSVRCRERKVLIFGDSITQGYDARYPSHSYASILTELLHADARNKGIGGEQFNDALIDREEIPDVNTILVAFGTNDWGGKKTPDEIQKKVTAFYGSLAKYYPNADIFAITPIWRGDEKTRRQDMPFLQVGEIIREEIASFPNIRMIDGYNLIPHDPTLYSEDLLHPNDIGCAHYANQLFREIT